MSPELRLPGTIAEIEASPTDPSIGAFFDLDGTLIAGYSAAHLARQRLKERDFSPLELFRTMRVVLTSDGISRESMADLLDAGAASWHGRAKEDLDQMGERLFEQKIADLIYPEMREVVRAHQRRGHTVVLASSATSFQVDPVASYLGVDHVLCNRFEEDGDGLLTGKVLRPVLWGPGKSEAAQAFAASQGVAIERSYFYADGDEDTAFMYLVGEPRPTNPGRHLERVAKRRGWPIVKLRSRGETSRVRAALGLASLVPVAGAGIGLGLLKRDRRAATNFIAEHWLDLMFAANGVELAVVDEDNAWIQRPAVFIFNHRNGFDPFMATRIVKTDFAAVAKSELRKDPIIGTFGRFIDIAYVERGNAQQSVEALKQIEQLVEKDLSIIISPEGTRFDAGEVGPFKKGAFRMAMAAGIPIVPIVIRNAEAIGGRNATAMNPGRVDIAVLEPISTEDWSVDSLDSHIEAVRQLYIDTLGSWPAPPTD